MKKFSIPGIDENDIEFYTGHTGCVKIKNATDSPQSPNYLNEQVHWSINHRIFLKCKSKWISY